MTRWIVALFIVLASLAAAQELPPQTPPPDPGEPPIVEPIPEPQPFPEVAEPAPDAPDPAEPEREEPPPVADRRDPISDANIYLPEGELDIKVRRLIKNSLFEGQVNYNFVDGDVSTFLRYKYYSRNFAYKLGVFDELEFDELGGETNEFDRTRGGLLLISYPKDYDTRYTLLTQVDSLAYGDLTRPDNDTTNVYLKLGYQLGTETDERLNSIVGESRGRIIPVLTAYRDIGPRQTGMAVALTTSLESIGSDFDYVKLEGEVLKRFDFTNESLLLTRAHVGTFLQRTRLTDDPEIEDFNEFLIPRYELFQLGGRDALKGIDFDERGTDELHATAEYLRPVFRNRRHRFLGALVRDLYWIAYSGVGTAVYETSDLTELDRWVVDTGLGFEVGMRVRDYEIILTAIYAMPVVKPDGLEGGEFRVSARTARY